MTQPLGIIAAILVTLGVLVGLPYYLYKTPQILVGSHAHLVINRALSTFARSNSAFDTASFLV
jgi:hypothetical protein